MANKRYSKIRNAIIDGDLEQVDRMMTKRYLKQLTTRDRASLLVTAMKEHHIDILATLLEHGFDPNVSYRSKQLLQHAISIFDKHEMRNQVVELLLSHGADPRLGCKLRWPLEQVLADMSRGYNNKWDDRSYHESAMLVKLLLERGAYPNDGGVGNYADYPLCHAVVIRNRDVSYSLTELLLAHGADPNIGTPDSSKGVRRYKGFGMERQSPLWRAVLCRNYRSAKLLLKAGADPNYRCVSDNPRSNGRTILTRLSNMRSRSDRFLKSLLSHGADPNLTDLYGGVPLHQFRYNRPQSEILIQYGADTNFIYNGHSVLSYYLNSIHQIVTSHDRLISWLYLLSDERVRATVQKYLAPFVILYGIPRLEIQCLRVIRSHRIDTTDTPVRLLRPPDLDYEIYLVNLHR